MIFRPVTEVAARPKPPLMLVVADFVSTLTWGAGICRSARPGTVERTVESVPVRPLIAAVSCVAVLPTRSTRSTRDQPDPPNGGGAIRPFVMPVRSTRSAMTEESRPVTR